MRNSLSNSINQYLRYCKNSIWVANEAYKFEFANYVNANVKWQNQTNEEILGILTKSQDLKYTNSLSEKGVQFIKKSGRKKLSEYITIKDVELFRKARESNLEEIDWSSRGMSYTVMTAWLASLFPEKIYPVPLSGFNQTISYLFDTEEEKFPKKGEKYIFGCQKYLAKTEKILQEYPIEEICLKECNNFYEIRPELNIPVKEKFLKIDWIWLVQDFHLFVQRNILGKHKRGIKEIKIQEDLEPIAIEGKSVLATHMKFERNSNFIKKIKEQALKENFMLNCEGCGFSFLDFYGEVGKGFIEAHHKNELSQQGGQTKTTRKDIALICSNCHKMLHKKTPSMTIDELKKLIIKNQ